MSEIIIKGLGEYIPNNKCTISLNRIKEFTTVPYFIDWYKSSESNKVFPLFLQEISDLNPTRIQIPGILTRNPFFDHAWIKYFVAYKDSKPVGRIMAFIDYNYIISYNENTGWIGLFESVEDTNVAQKLFDCSVNYLKSNGCKVVIGPAKFNANGEIGLLVEGFDKKPYFIEPYNAPYYQEFFEKYGFKKENDWYSVHMDKNISDNNLKRISDVIGRLEKSERGSFLNEFNIRNVNFKNMIQEINLIEKIYNTEWGKGEHPQFVKMTHEEFTALSSGMKTLALEDLIFIVEKDNKPIGVSVCLPNINEVIMEYDSKNKNYMPSKNLMNFRDLKRDISIFNYIKKRLKEKNFESMRVLILGVEEAYRGKGIDAKLYLQTAETAMKLGIKHASASQLADINKDILNPLFKMGEKVMTWRVYRLEL